ncbi:MAG: AMP-binding protein [Candidatus Tritonobacter lacicola]|nr:AMP-binding protein [Candidatus Tritonobacter lacicola]
MSLYSKFREAAKKYPDRVALRTKAGSDYRCITYGEMPGMVEGLALSIQEMGIAKGDRVAIFSENRPEWASALFAINLAGGVAVPLDTHLTQDELKNLIADSGSKLIFTSSSLLGAVSSLGERPKIISFDGDAVEGSTSFTKMLSGAPGKCAFPEVHTEDLALLLYTSGTTGRPKGVMLSNKNLLSNAESIYESGICSHEDNFISILPLHHAYPLMLNLILPLSCGAGVTIARSLKKTELGECMRETGGTILVGVPQIYALFHDSIMGKIKELSLHAKTAVRIFLSLARALRRLTKVNVAKLLFRSAHRFFGPRLRFLVSGGARLDPAVEKDLLKLGFTVLQGYGLTETSPVVTMTREGSARIGSVGLPLPGVEVRIDDPNEDGTGQIVVKGPNVMMGYYRNKKETADVIKDDWLATGDLGYRDREGHIFITGRLKEVIVLPSGMNVYPEEVESHYLKSPFIKELCVMGGDNDGLFALILPDFDYMKEQGEAYSRDMIRWQVEDLSLKLTPHKRIMGYEILREPLPRTRLGKIKRNIVRDSLKKAEAEGRETAGAADAGEYDLELLGSNKARAIISFVSGSTGMKKEIRLSDNLELDLGIDSLGRTQLLADVEEMFGCTIPDETAARIITIHDLVDAVPEAPGLKPGIKKSRKISWREILKGEPAVKLDDIIPLQPGLSDRVILFTAHRLIRILSALYFRVTLRGLKNIPREGPFILCPNHVSFLDSPILGAALPYSLVRRLYFVALTPYFSGKSPLKFFVRVLKIIMADSSEHILSSMQLAAQVVQKGSCLCIFPEGGRSIDGAVKEFKKGVGIMAKELNVLLVPVLIDGTYEALPKSVWFPRPRKVRITIGKPIRPDRLDLDRMRRGDEDDYEVITECLRKRIIDLKRENINH